MSRHSPIWIRNSQITNRKSSRSNGFTLIELLLAMAIFSFLLLIAAGGFTNIVRLHRVAAAARTTQQTARSVMEQVVREVRSASAAKTVISTDPSTSGTTRLCLTNGAGTVMYYLVANSVTPLDDSLHEAKLATSSCPPGAFSCPSAAACDRSLTGAGVAVVKWFVKIIPTNLPVTYIFPRSVQIELRVATNAALVSGAQSQCNPAVTGSGTEFCSVTVLQSAASLQGPQ